MQEKSIKMQGKCAGAKNQEESEKHDPPAPEFRVNHGLTFKVCSDPPDRVSLFCQRKIKSSKLLLFCEFPVYRSSQAGVQKFPKPVYRSSPGRCTNLHQNRCTKVAQTTVQNCPECVVQKCAKPLVQKWTKSLVQKLLKCVVQK